MTGSTPTAPNDNTIRRSSEPAAGRPSNAPAPAGEFLGMLMRSVRSSGGGVQTADSARSAQLPPIADGQHRRNSESRNDDQRELRRTPAAIDLAALAVSELSSRDDASPSAAVVNAEAVAKQDREGRPDDAARSSPRNRQPQPESRPVDPRVPQTSPSVRPPESPQTRPAEAPSVNSAANKQRAGAVQPASGPAQHATSRTTAAPAASGPGARATPVAHRVTAPQGGPAPTVGASKPVSVDRPSLARAPEKPQPLPGQHSSHQLEHEPAASQIGRGLAALLRQKGGSVTIKMRPESLGEVTVRMTLDSGRVDARFETVTPLARRLLNDTLTTLRSALEAQGLTVERLSVDEEARPNESARPEAADDDRVKERQGGSGGAGDSAGSKRGERDAAGSEHPETDAGEGAAGLPRPGVGHVLAEPIVVPEGAGASAGGVPIIRLRLNAIA